MITWDDLVDICVGQINDVLPTVFERALKDLAEPDFAKETKCLDAEKTYTTVIGTADYEMPLGVVKVKEASFRAIPLDETTVANLKQRERYHSDGTTLRQGTPEKYFLENDRIHLVPAPSSAANLRVSYFALPTYRTKKKRYLALKDTTTTVVYLDLAIGEDLKTDTVPFYNVTRDITKNCSDYVLDDGRHKYTVVAAIAGQVAGDEIEIDVREYVPMIPEIYAAHLLPYALAMGYASKENTALYEYWMKEYERKRDEVAGERSARGWPQQVISNCKVIR